VIISSAVLVDRERQRYSRYLPANTPKSKSFSRRPSAGIPSVLLEILEPRCHGTTRRRHPGTRGSPGVPDWFVLRSCSCNRAVLSINTIDLYSSGVTLQARSCRQRWVRWSSRPSSWRFVTALVLFHGDFYHDSRFLPLHRRLAGPVVRHPHRRLLAASRRYDGELALGPARWLYWRKGASTGRPHRQGLG